MSAEAQAAIAAKCDEIKALLLRKNEAYGDSVFETRRTFSDITDPLALIRVRMDDKLSRIRNAQETGFKDDEDPYLDLIGYLILYLVVGDAQRAGSDAETVDAALGDTETLVETKSDPLKTALEIISREPDAVGHTRHPAEFAARVMNAARNRAATNNQTFAPTLYSRTLDTIAGDHESYLYDGAFFDTAAAFAATVLAQVEAESA